VSHQGDLAAPLIAECKRYGVEHDIGVRWEKGTKHHPKSVELMKFVADLDFALVNDYFCWKTGGDGDNGETLMYEMDVFFDLQDAKANVEKLFQSGMISRQRYHEIVGIPETVEGTHEPSP
jgi:hypothetical protein